MKLKVLMMASAAMFMLLASQGDRSLYCIMVKCTKLLEFFAFQEFTLFAFTLIIWAENAKIATQPLII